VRQTAAQLADAARFDEAKALLERVIDEIRRAPAASNDAELSEALEQLIDDAALMQQRPNAQARAAFRRGQHEATRRPQSALLSSAFTNVPSARLVILEGLEPAEVPLRADMVLGRTASADLQLSSSSVSRMHTRITASDGAFWVNDLGSSNGTRLNGKPVRCERLRDGDILHVGAVKLLYREAR
jgi:pSer/pThr/pTyr-binding forkhead associated (FHA) protein